MIYFVALLWSAAVAVIGFGIGFLTGYRLATKPEPYKIPVIMGQQWEMPGINQIVILGSPGTTVRLDDGSVLVGRNDTVVCHVESNGWKGDTHIDISELQKHGILKL